MARTSIFWTGFQAGWRNRGTSLADGLCVCDILQCYLDVRGSRARGQEQADYIADNILLPYFRSEG